MCLFESGSGYKLVLWQPHVFPCDLKLILVCPLNFATYYSSTYDDKNDQ